MGLLRFLKSKLTRRRSTHAGNQLKDCHRKTTLSWDDVEKFTGGFSVPIAHGGFTTVYLAKLPRATAAVKLFRGCTHRLRHAFRQELHALQNIGRHDNIVRLLGYCENQDDSALILEYVAGGTLHERLHGGGDVLRWRGRLSIAFQLAQTVAYLHDACRPHVVHGDIKPANILLADGGLTCKLCDFGSARMGFSSAIIGSDIPRASRAAMVGSPGYTDPFYLKTGMASRQNDVYSFGVVLLELITGREAATAKRLRNVEAVVAAVDPRIRDEAGLDEVRTMAALSWRCLSERPGVRPSAADVVNVMKNGVPFLSFSCLDVKPKGA